MQLLISIIGTAIGVGLTFAVNNWMDNRKKEEDQRLMAIMVIHDIDESINTLKSMKENMETMYNAALYVREHLDQLDSVPNDTLDNALYFIIETEDEFRFDNSKEKIFHSSPETWQNLGCMKFIDNVQYCYYSRQEFQDAYNKSSFWQKPVSMNETERLKLDNSNLSLDEYFEQYLANEREFIKEKFQDESVSYFISVAPRKLGIIKDYIRYWSRVNDENKFLMSITDDELDSYVNSINTNGNAVTEKGLVGTWNSSSLIDEINQFEFRKDHTFSFLYNKISTANLNFSQGKLSTTYKETGTWKLEGDTLITIPDSVDLEVDASKMVVQPERQEMLDRWVQNYKEEYISAYKKNIKEGGLRRAWHARLDASRDKMELEIGESAVYYKREK